MLGLPINTKYCYAEASLEALSAVNVHHLLLSQAHFEARRLPRATYDLSGNLQGWPFTKLK